MFRFAVSDPIDYSARWPSAYADNGEVGWSRTQAQEGHLAVSFPQIRYVFNAMVTSQMIVPSRLTCSWASLRATEGWAALQHHTVLHAFVTVHPPTHPRDDQSSPPHLLVDLLQGSFFAVLPSQNDTGAPAASRIPRWYAGNIYAMKAAPAQAVPLPIPPSLDKPTTYDIFISGDYEVSC